MNKEEYWRQYTSSELCIDFSKDFDIWWDPIKFNWDWNDYLPRCLPDKFDTWWDPDRFNWMWNSSSLCVYLPYKFNKWWDVEKFNWHYSKFLIKHILNQITVWYSPTTINVQYTYTKVITVNIGKIYEYVNSMEWDYE